MSQVAQRKQFVVMVELFPFVVDIHDLLCYNMYNLVSICVSAQ